MSSSPLVMVDSLSDISVPAIADPVKPFASVAVGGLKNLASSIFKNRATMPDESRARLWAAHNQSLGNQSLLFCHDGDVIDLDGPFVEAGDKVDLGPESQSSNDYDVEIIDNTSLGMMANPPLDYYRN